MDPNSVLNNDPLPELEKVKVPDYQPQYNFKTQFRAIFMKKVWTTFRSFSVVTSLMLPVIFIVLGVIISMIAYKTPSTASLQQIAGSTWGKFYTIGYFMVLAFSFNTGSYCGNIVREREIKFKYLAYVMGMKKTSYWLGTISFDFMMFLLPFDILLIVIGCFPAS